MSSGTNGTNNTTNVSEEGSKSYYLSDNGNGTFTVNSRPTNLNNNGSPNTLGNRKNFQNFAQNLKRVKERRDVRKKDEAIKKATDSMDPIKQAAGNMIANSPLTKAGLDKAYNSGFTQAEKDANVKKYVNTLTRKILMLILKIVLPVLFIIFIVLLVALFFENVDSQIFSNENGGTVYSDDYIGDDKVVNVFANYPGLYEEVMNVTDRVSKEYGVEIDKYLIIATLVTPISQNIITPIEDSRCGEEDCYYFDGKAVSWSEFLKSWSQQAELLAKMQMLTYVNHENKLSALCSDIETMEQYAMNDSETNTFPWYGWLNPANWFKGFVDAAQAEVNAKCVYRPGANGSKIPLRNGESVVPAVRVLSIEEGTYYETVNEDGSRDYIKDPNSGGVYFWNLVNVNGFIHEYLKDYLSKDYADNPEKNYEINKRTIVQAVNDIYSYYETIRKDCNGRPVIKGELKKVKFREDYNSPVYTIDFEEMFVGGSVLATNGSVTGDLAKAQVILTRSEAYNFIVEQGEDIITGSSKMGCWWQLWNPTYNPNYEDQKDNPNYDPDYPKRNFPEIYKAITETRGLVVTLVGDTKVLETEYDAFCPTTRIPVNGFYYLPDGQRNLPIEQSSISNWADCPCFQNQQVRPDIEFAESLNALTQKSISEPSQTTLSVCWTPTSEIKVEKDALGFEKILHGFEYQPTGGHGRGASQHGLAYFVEYGYDYEALIKLFFDRDHSGVSLKRLDYSILDYECDNHGYFTAGENELRPDNPYANNGGSGDGGAVSSNFTSEIGGNPLTKPLPQALAENGHTMQDLNDCISSKVRSAGPGTRDGVVAASVGLLQCLMSYTGGYTLPYDHSGGKAAEYNPDIFGKLGANSKWGNPGGTCDADQTGVCRVGMNCANFVRWSMCNGGMDLCSRGSSFAVDMVKSTYFPGEVRIMIGPNFRVVEGSTSISSAEEAFSNIKPGDVLYSRGYPQGGSNHAMVIVGVDGGGITIAENGRKTRRISKGELLGTRDKQYDVILLDAYYSNASNKNNLY